MGPVIGESRVSLLSIAIFFICIFQLIPESDAFFTQRIQHQTPNVIHSYSRTILNNKAQILMKEGDEGFFKKTLGSIFGGKGKSDSLAPTRKRKSELDSAIDTLLKDAPLPVKIAGGLIKGVAGVMGAMVAETQDDVALVLDEAEKAMRFDPKVESILGNQVRCSSPFSQSYSSMNINGKVSKQISLQVGIEGSKASGTASISATTDSTGSIKLNQLLLSTPAGGINVEVLSYNGRGSSTTSSRGDPGIVDVDVIE
mmetsp:Transcript_9042/g.11759  ORF Transcript_9042/g.11759 Transcript_9042/m.11759 type:complete len:256 (-) Transcript_9042:324-1091(-)